MSDLWVFGYGSLMWRPGFAFEEAVPSRLYGAHRSLCIYSWVHRGTKAQPGLVLGLDLGGSCRGIAFRVAGANRDEVVAYLRARELVTDVYVEATRRVVLQGQAAPVDALTYVVDRTHEQYAGRLPLERQLHHVRRSSGGAGPNSEYVLNTAQHLRDLGVHDHGLEWLSRALEPGYQAASGRESSSS